MEQSNRPFDQRWLIKTIRNSMLTALAMDSLGTIFEDYSPDARIRWLQGDRNSYPKTKKPRKASFNTDFMVLMLAVMTQVMPTTVDDMEDYQTEFQVALNQYYYAVASPRSDNRYVRVLRGDTNTGLSIPVGMFVGMYSAVVFADRSFLYALVDATCKTLCLKSRDRDDVKFYAFLCYRLAIDGYFGHSYFKELMAHKVVPSFIYKVFKNMMASHIDVDYLSEPYIVHQPSCCFSVAESVITESMFYMSRVDASFNRDILPSGPKDQLAEVFTSETSGLADIGFVYGGICTLSEHNYSLITKPLRENVGVRKVVDDFLKYVQ